MANYSRLEVYNLLGTQGMVPVFYTPDTELIKKVLTACYEGGVRSFEFTNRGDFAHEVFSEVNRWALKELPGMMLGVGSVIDAGTTSIYLQSGANFIVSPILSNEMASVCNRRKVAWIPGCGTPTEISKAEELGAEIVKIFPGTAVGGPGFVKAFLGPSPWSKIMPTGGVEPGEENLTAWFNAGVYCVGMGSKLISKEMISKGDFAGITKKCSSVLETIKRIRK